MKQKPKKRSSQKNRKKVGRHRRRKNVKTNLLLMNFKISRADRRLFRKLADELTHGNVSALIMRAVKTASKRKIQSFR